MKQKKYIPVIHSNLKRGIVKVPEVIYRASGISILGTRIKSIIFTTDVALIKNHNAQAIMAVYPFTPQLTITQAVLDVASVPVFAGVGGGVTSGVRSINLAFQSELLGVYGVVVNATMSLEVIREMKAMTDVPIIATIASPNEDVLAKIEAGAAILNISGAAKTVEMTRAIRKLVGPEFPIIATGGPTDETILATIEAGANAITFTPPTSADLFSVSMQKYRDILSQK
ncbi:MAG: hydrolase [Tissierellia bacterium]|nr:hydrolase [Tissierellia bacterium]